MRTRLWLAQDQKLQTIERAIEDLVSGSRGHEYASINRTQTARCLERHRYEMVDDFDETYSARPSRTNPVIAI